MAYDLRLKNKLLLFWFGSLISTLLLIGFLFQYMLTELHQEEADYKMVFEVKNARAPLLFNWATRVKRAEDEVKRQKAELEKRM